jgi:hypothetical protein
MDRRIRTALACLLLTACQRAPFESSLDDESSGSGDDTGNVDSGPVTDGDNDSGIAPVFGCDPGDEKSCPTGEKCTAISEGGPQNHFQCVPDDGMLIPGDECTPAEGTGQDGCTTGHVCLRNDPDAQLGRCLAACTNDDDCEPGACQESPYTLTTFCADPCDPIVPECDMGFNCHQTDDRFVCDMLLSDTDIGQAGEPCDAVGLRGCAANLACLNGALVPGCFGQSCCATVCDLTVGDEQCPSPTLCRPLFTAPAPGFENVGACYVPA